MSKAFIFWLMLASFVAGCGTHPPAKKVDNAMNQPTVLKKILVKGFDPDGEPEIRVMSDGSVFIVFNFMPPPFDENQDKYADFDKQLEKALGVGVLWEDREFFLIRKPAGNTVEKARAFLESYRKSAQK